MLFALEIILAMFTQTKLYMIARSCTIMTFLSVFALCTLQVYGQKEARASLRHFMQVKPSPAGSIQYGNNPKAGKYANAGDAKIYYEVYGKGKPLVVLHGGGMGSTYEMCQFIDSLSNDYQVIAISTRGHGKSEIGNSPVTSGQRANDALARD